MAKREANDRSDADEYRQLLMEAVADLRAFELKYGFLPELREAMDKFHKLEADLGLRRE